MEQKRPGIFRRLREWGQVLRNLRALSTQVYNLLAAFSCLEPCPHCGAILDKRCPELEKYRGKSGKPLCCVGCRAFVKKPLVRVSGFESTKKVEEPNADLTRKMPAV